MLQQWQKTVARRPDAFDMDDADEQQEPGDVACNRCGATGLEWVHTGVNWRLADERGLHQCNAANDFDTL